MVIKTNDIAIILWKKCSTYFQLWYSTYTTILWDKKLEIIAVGKVTLLTKTETKFTFYLLSRNSTRKCNFLKIPEKPDHQLLSKFYQNFVFN